MADITVMTQVLRGLVGDKLSYHNPTWYTDAELFDILSFAIKRHNTNFTLESLPVDQTTMVCYRAAIDICHELAAKNAPFSVVEIEGFTVNKSQIMNNWIDLSNRYREFYLIEMTGGLGAQGQILQGELTRFSYTTGREVPGYQIQPITPPILSLQSQSALTAIVQWTTVRNYDFYAYKLYRRSQGETDFTFLWTGFNPLTVTYTDTLSLSGIYEYRIDVVRGLNLYRTTNYPFNPSIYDYLVSSSNILAVSVN